MLHRVAILCFLVRRVVCVTTDIPCGTPEDFQALPLPSAKSLWEAGKRSLWRQEYEAGISTQKTNMTVFGELIEAEQRAGEKSNTQKLDIWHSGVDSLGILLTLVTSTV